MYNRNFKQQNKIGELRPNQLITTFGPGAIHDAVKDSLTILDINYWGETGRRIYDARLASYFGVDYFCSPKTSYGQDVPAISFPNYHVCSNSKCCRLFNIKDHFKLEEYLKQGSTCPDCGYRAYPSRFVVACKDGHLDDFPWSWWVHRGKKGCNGNLKLISTGETSTLGEMFVECTKCETRRSMAGATDKVQFAEAGYTCTGRHPHRPKEGNRKCDCTEIFPAQRGASNIYFPVIRSAISIPPWTNPLYILLDEHYAMLCNYKRDFGEDGVTKIYENYFKENYPRDAFNKALENREKKIKEFIEIKEMEYKAFTHHNDPSYKRDIRYFKATEDNVPNYLQKYFSRIIKIERLREVMVLQGFMRIDPPEPEADSLKRMVKLTATKKPNSWLPGVEINGEGIFIEFNKEVVRKWLNSPTVKQLSAQYKTLFDAYCAERKWENIKERDAKYVLLHTFAHLMIKEMALHSGYSSTAIKERIYSDTDSSDDGMCGILFYTGSSDKEGSLGGLVELGEEEKFKSILKSALENSLMCTTDPECTNSEIDVDTLNGSACHSCAMIAETACENGNRLLDRSLITPLDGKEGNSFFKDLIGELCGIVL